MDSRKKQELLKRQIDEKMKQAGEDKRYGAAPRSGRGFGDPSG